MAIDQLTQIQLSILLGPDSSHFETLISHLMSSSNEQRSHAESLFNLCKQTHPDSLALKLVQSLNSSSNPELRAMSAVLLRKQLTRTGDDDDSAFIYPRIAESTRLTLKSVLITSLQQESTKSIAKKVCDTISELASAILPENGWPELLPFMFQCVVAADNPNLQEYALLIFSRLAQYIGETLIPYLSTLHSVFSQSLRNSTSADVRITALGAAINFIQCLSKASDRDIFQDLLPLMMQTLTEALNSGQEATAQEALELLIELAGTEPRFLRRQIVEIVGSMLQIAEAESLEEGTRHLAVEFVITLAKARERAPGMIRKLPQFITKLFSVLMNMLLDIEDDPAWHSAENEDEDAGETSNYGFGQECLDRLAISLGGNTIVPVASEVFSGFFAASEWQKHHAALIALAQIAEGCSKVMIKNLEQVVSMVLNSFQHPHPRVRWAAINAIGQLSTDLGPVLQTKYHQSVLPALVGAMDDFQNPRVQAHAASAVLNFSENCTPEILTPYLDGVISKLLVLLQTLGSFSGYDSPVESSPISHTSCNSEFDRRGVKRKLWSPDQNGGGVDISLKDGLFSGVTKGNTTVSDSPLVPYDTCENGDEFDGKFLMESLRNRGLQNTTPSPQRQRSRRINAEDFNIFSTPRKLISSLQYPDFYLDHSDIQSPIPRSGREKTIGSRKNPQLRKQFSTMAETMSSTVKCSGDTSQTQMISGKKKKMSYAKFVIAISFVAMALFTTVILILNQDDDVGYYTVPT